MHATVLLMPPTMRRQFSFFNDSQIPVLAAHYKAGVYERTTPHVFGHADTEPESAAEEMFDLTNNPSRQEERELAYGIGRSLSVGDIVEVQDGETITALLCCSVGWKTI